MPFGQLTFDELNVFNLKPTVNSSSRSKLVFFVFHLMEACHTKMTQGPQFKI